MTYEPVAVIRPPRGLATTAQTLIVITTVVHAAATVGDWLRGWPTPVLTALDYLVLFVAAGFFMAWLYQAWANAAVIVAPRRMRWDRGWTIGSWFVPVGNFVLPCLVVLNVCDASSGWRTSSRRFVTLWWLLFLLAEIAGRGWFRTYAYQSVNGRVVSYREQLYSLHSELPLWAIMTVVEAASATLAVLLVRRVTGMQSAAAWSRAAATP